MFKFKATLGVPSAAEARIDELFEALLSEQFSKRTGSDFSISFNEHELKIEFCDVELTEKFAQKILGCGPVKKFYIENQAESKNKPEKEIEAKVKAAENEHVTGSETEAETDSEAKKEETESDSEDDTDANAEAGAEEIESEPEPEEVPKAEAKEEMEVTSETKAEEKPNVEAEHESEKFSLDYVNEMFEKAETVTHFYEDLAEYAQIPNELKEDFVEYMRCARNVDKRMPLFLTYGFGTKYSCKVDFYMVKDELPYRTREINPAKKEVFSKTIEETLGVSIEWFICDVVNIVISHPSKPVFKRKAKAEEEFKPEPEPEVIPEAKAEEEPEPEPELEVIPEAKAEEEPEPEPESEVIPEAKAEEEPEPEPEPEVISEAKAEEKSFEEFSKEYAEKLYEESESLEVFSRKLADYIQISDSRIRNAFEELIKGVDETQKMSWFCIEKIIKKNSEGLYRRAEFNTNTKVLISKAVKERFNLTLLVFLKLIKKLMTEANSKAEEESKPESEPEVTPEAKAEEESKPESEPEVTPEAKAEEETKLDPESEEIPETTAKEESKPEPESEEIPKAEAEETFDEYWSGIFKCMPKIISTDTYRIENASKKEQQFLAINKSNPMAFRIKEVLEIMEDISLVADPNFITLSEQIFTKMPVIKVEKDMALYQKMRLLQWSKMLQKFVQKYYTNDPNFRVRIENFLTELREIIMTPEEIAKIK